MRADLVIVCAFAGDSVIAGRLVHSLTLADSSALFIVVCCCQLAANTYHQHKAVYITVGPTNTAWNALGSAGDWVYTPTQWVPEQQLPDVKMYGFFVRVFLLDFSFFE